jgi:hypothetical protein
LCRYAAVEGLLAYSRAIPTSTPSREMAVKEGAFRNGWFLAVVGLYTFTHSFKAPGFNP